MSTKNRNNPNGCWNNPIFHEALNLIRCIQSTFGAGMVKRKLYEFAGVSYELSGPIESIIAKNASLEERQLGVNAVALKIRSLGHQVSKEELKAAGIRSNTKIGSSFWGALSDEAKKDPIEAALLLVNPPTNKFPEHSPNVQDALRSANNYIEARYAATFISADDSCHKAKQLNGKTVNPPQMPLPGCNKDYCKCTYGADTSTSAPSVKSAPKKKRFFLW